MKSHPQSKDPYIDPFAEQTDNRPASTTPVALKRSDAIWLVVVCGMVLVLVAAVLTAPARAIELSTKYPSFGGTPTPRPIWTPGCEPPTCIERTTTKYPSLGGTPESTSTPTATSEPTATRSAPPDWLDIACLKTIQQIMQAELRGSTDDEALRFLATQLLYRATENKRCIFPGWTLRAAGSIPPRVSTALNSVVTDYPAMRWPRCQFVGASGGYAVWKSKGMIKRDMVVIAFVADPIGEIFGVNCTPG